MKKILYVEDDAINALILKKLLSKEYAVRVAGDEQACLQSIKEEDFDLILMDINLGDKKMEGVRLMKQVKKVPKYVNTKVIAVTGLSLPEEQAHLISEGFDAFLSKPIEEDKLKKTIKDLLH